ncbi:hypothetical protein niasHT_023881 [Heterodera trifolii]|uniref:Secreted protein n=1 Tax=Heterodera trifolii TaxID=157864 RepID=A0ABD2JCH3_9BILA
MNVEISPLFLFFLFFVSHSSASDKDGTKERLKRTPQPMPAEVNSSLLTKELIRRLRANNELVLHRIRSYRRMRKTKRRVRTSRHSISSAIVETANCEHVELIDCDEYGDKSMQCMLTATGMPCCICNGRLKLRKKRRHRGRRDG